MIKIIIIFILFAITAFLQIQNLKKQQLYKELYTYATLMGLAFILTSLYVLNIPIPNPLNLINFIFKPIANLIYGFLR